MFRYEATLWSEPSFSHGILQVACGDVHLTRRALVGTVPGPLLAHLLAHRAVEHLSDVFAEVGQELPRVE